MLARLTAMASGGAVLTQNASDVGVVPPRAGVNRFEVRESDAQPASINIYGPLPGREQRHVSPDAGTHGITPVDGRLTFGATARVIFRIPDELPDPVSDVTSCSVNDGPPAGSVQCADSGIPAAIAGMVFLQAVSGNDRNTMAERVKAALAGLARNRKTVQFLPHGPTREFSRRLNNLSERAFSGEPGAWMLTQRDWDALHNDIRKSQAELAPHVFRMLMHDLAVQYAAVQILGIHTMQAHQELRDVARIRECMTHSCAELVKTLSTRLARLSCLAASGAPESWVRFHHEWENLLDVVCKNQQLAPCVRRVMMRDLEVQYEAVRMFARHRITDMIISVEAAARGKDVGGRWRSYANALRTTLGGMAIAEAIATSGVTDRQCIDAIYDVVKWAGRRAPYDEWLAAVRVVRQEANGNGAVAERHICSPANVGVAQTYADFDAGGEIASSRLTPQGPAMTAAVSRRALCSALREAAGGLNADWVIEHHGLVHRRDIAAVRREAERLATLLA